MIVFAQGDINVRGDINTSGADTLGIGDGFDGGFCFLSSDLGSVTVQNITTDGGDALGLGNGGNAGEIVLVDNNSVFLESNLTFQPLATIGISGTLSAQGGTGVQMGQWGYHDLICSK